MSALRPLVPLIAHCLVLIWALVAAAAEQAPATTSEAEALAADTECSAGDATGGDSECALSALQFRGVKARAENKEAVEADPAAALPQKSPTSFWPFSNSYKTSGPGGCNQDTGGTCRIFGCRSGRNSRCESHKCICRPNFCAVDPGSSGMCEIPPSTLKVDVVRVDPKHHKFPAPHNSIDTAICLSGGGARAASLTIGVLRALENLKLMPKVDAISSVSGSLFVSINYMFADTSMYLDRDKLKDKNQPLWGPPSEPSQLTLASLDYDTSPLGTLFADGWGGTWATAKDVVSKFIPKMTKDRDELDGAWRRLMRRQFLKPFGLGDKDSFLAADAAAVQRIKAANPQLANFSFMTPQPGKPKVFVICASILALEGEKKQDAASFQISPDYTGTPFYTNVEHRPLYAPVQGGRLSDSVIGGGLIETFGVGGAAPADQDGSPRLASLPSPARPFTLSDAIAIATYADFLPGETVFGWTPTYRYWPIGDGKEKEKRYQIGDAGFIEDTGLLPMIQRRAKRIGLFLFAGPGQQINQTIDFCGLKSQIKAGTFDTKTFDPAGKLADSIYVLFGYGYDDGMWHKKHNTVFKQAEMFSVACELQKLKTKGKPQVYRTKHQVQPNAYWGIPGDYTVEVVYVYNDQLPEFEKQLPADTQKALKSSLKGFPTDLPAGLYMKPRIIKLMAAQSEYMVLQHADTFRKLFK